jgi:hypothetical protein
MKSLWAETRQPGVLVSWLSADFAMLDVEGAELEGAELGGARVVVLRAGSTDHLRMEVSHPWGRGLRTGGLTRLRQGGPL